MPVKDGDKVKIEYEGKLDDGTVFDSSAKHGKPLEFEVGTKKVIPGFENAVRGMEKGEEKEVKLTPAESYGDVNPQLLKKVPKEKIPSDKPLQVGMMLAVGMPDGRQIPARIAEVGDKDITVDFNHPLAGKNLNFKIKVVEISS